MRLSHRLAPHHRRGAVAPGTTEEEEMLLATTKVGGFDRFIEVFSTKGAEKRKQHGSKSSTVFRDPNGRTGSGRSSTGTRQAGRASSPIPRSRRSFRKLD